MLPTIPSPPFHHRLHLSRFSIDSSMSAINCCSYQRSPSPDLPNSRVIQPLPQSETSPVRTLDPIPFITPASTMGSAQSREIRELFASSQDTNTPQHTTRKKRTKRELPLATVRHKGSGGRLPNLAERLKRKMSRESGLSRKSSRMRLRRSPSDEEIRRRQELKQALHRRLQEDLLRDRSASNGGYDEDAVVIVTPQLTLGRGEGFEQSVRGDIPVAFRPGDPSQTSDRKFSGQSKPEKYSPKITTIQDGLTVRKVLRKKKSAPAAFLGGQHPTRTVTEPEIRLTSGQSSSPFHFNNLVIPKRSRLSLRKAPVESLDTAKGKFDRVRPGIRVKGASGLFGRSTPNMRLQFGHVGELSHEVPHAHGANCDPAIEELGFGGIDGAADHRAQIDLKSTGQKGTHSTHTAVKRQIRISQSLSRLDSGSGQAHQRRSSSMYSRPPNTYRSSSQYSTRSSVLEETFPGTAVEAQSGQKHTARYLSNGMRRKYPPKNIASSVYSSHNNSRKSIPNLDGSREPRSATRRQSTAYDLLNVENKEVTSLWEKAFHAEGDAAMSNKTRRTSMLPRRKGSVAVTRQASVSQDTASSVPKLAVPERSNRGRRRPILRKLDTHLSSSSLRSLSPSEERVDSTRSTNTTHRKGRDTSSARSSGSWARFPSHTRAERSSSPASSSDGVHTRDFATNITKTLKPNDKPFGIHPEMDKRKSRSLHFRKNITNTLGRLYRSHVELRGFDKGHRSSISAGGVLEYPELELPAGLGEGGATVWSRMYEDCVHPRDAADRSFVTNEDLEASRWEGSGSLETVDRAKVTSRGRVL